MLSDNEVEEDDNEVEEDDNEVEEDEPKNFTFHCNLQLILRPAQNSTALSDLAKNSTALSDLAMQKQGRKNCFRAEV